MQIGMDVDSFPDFERKRSVEFLPMAFLVVQVGLASCFVPGHFVRSVAKRLILGQAAHANPNRFILRLNLERSLVGFENLAH